jgi:thiamine pyrophosphate-dependent acetolactate synthase large subunit-like protein
MSGEALQRRHAVEALLSSRAGAGVGSRRGGATNKGAARGANESNNDLWGAMGGTLALGLGLALAQPETPVIVVTGDGDMFMGLGSFAALAQQAPGNLTLAVLDNGLYGETGGQETPSSGRADLAAIARACGIDDCRKVATLAEVEDLALRAHRVAEAPCVAVVKISREDPGRVVPIREGAYNKSRLRVALGLSAD